MGKRFTNERRRGSRTMVQEVKEIKPQLYPYQKRAVKFIEENKRCALWIECGLGKTAVTIEAFKHLPKPILILAPKRVAVHTWVEELTKWSPELKYAQLSDTPAKRTKALASKADVYIINYELVPWLVEASAKRWKFPTVVADESTKLKNRGTKLFKALRKVAKHWERHIQLTGTPSPQGLTDLWSQLYLIDKGKRLGKTLTAFRDRWFNADYMGWNYTPKPHAQKEIEDLCRDKCLSMTAEDYLDLPEMVLTDIIVDLPTKAKQIYNQLKKDLTIEVADDQHITAVNAAVLTNKLLQCTSGVVYDEEGTPIDIHTVKIEAIQDIIDTIGYEPLLVVYQFKSELRALRKAFRHLVEVRDDKDIIDRWNKGQIALMAVHPASAGHGLNLQHGGNHIVWTTPTWNLEHYLQTNARLHRKGQTKPVIVHRLLAENTVDQKVVNAVSNKASIQELLLKSLK